jgi:hypothetical protein
MDRAGCAAGGSSRLALVVMMAVSVGCGAACGGLRASERATAANDVQGTWQGQILVPDAPVIVTLRLGQAQSGTLDVRHRPLKDAPLRLVTRPDSPQFLAVCEQEGSRVSFQGVREGNRIHGTFREEGRSYEFWLTRTGS